MSSPPFASAEAGSGTARPADGSGAWLGRVLAVVLLVLVLPVAAIVALLVLARLGRPILFRQTRSGFGARPFTIWKFRTMRETRDSDGRLLPDAMRQTPLMQVLRRLRVDELPQLMAIAAGDMAFVGPRPLLPSTIADFGEAGLRRCSVRPGLTGWAQVNGNTRLDDRQKLALDLWYVDHRDLALDARILASTVWVILSGERVNRVPLNRAMAEMRSRAPSRSQGAPSC